MRVIKDIEFVLLVGLLWLVTAFMVWAFLDCLTRKTEAFTAAGKLSKPAWLGLSGLPALIGVLFSLSEASTVMSILIYIGVTCSSVYMADVRPAVRAISR